MGTYSNLSTSNVIFVVYKYIYVLYFESENKSGTLKTISYVLTQIEVREVKHS
jgi:hypothetical protein